MKGKYIILTCTLIITIFIVAQISVRAGEYVCGGGLHVMTDISYPTYVTTYDHSSPHGTRHVRIEEVKKVSKCQCGYKIITETVSKKELHSLPH